jgi:hypothetical protein
VKTEARSTSQGLMHLERADIATKGAAFGTRPRLPSLLTSSAPGAAKGKAHTARCERCGKVRRSPAGGLCRILERDHKFYDCEIRHGRNE